MKTVLSRIAQQELTGAFRYYEHEQHGLGSRFLDDVQHARQLIVQLPLRGIRSVYRYGAGYCATFRTA